jgi:hypothetical protein
MVPGKVNLSPCNFGRYKGEMVYGSMRSEPRHYMEMSGKFHASAALTTRNKTRLPFSRRLDGNQSRSGSFADPAGNRQPLAFSSHRIWPLARKNCKTLFSYKSVYDKITLKIYTEYSSSSSTSCGHAVMPINDTGWSRKYMLLISSKGHLVLPSSDGSPVKACVCVCDFYPSNVMQTFLYNHNYCQVESMSSSSRQQVQKRP